MSSPGPDHPLSQVKFFIDSVLPILTFPMVLFLCGFLSGPLD